MTVSNSANKPSDHLHIFLSYTSKDRLLVRYLYEQLCKVNGITAWFDETILMPDEWEHIVATTLRNTQVILVCISSHILTKTGTIHSDIRYTLKQAQTLDLKPSIVLVKIEACDIPDSLHGYPVVNWFETNGGKQLFDALQQHTSSVLTTKLDAPNGKGNTTVLSQKHLQLLEAIAEPHENGNTQPQHAPDDWMVAFQQHETTPASPTPAPKQPTSRVDQATSSTSSKASKASKASNTPSAASSHTAHSTRQAHNSKTTQTANKTLHTARSMHSPTTQKPTEATQRYSNQDNTPPTTVVGAAPLATMMHTIRSMSIRTVIIAAAVVCLVLVGVWQLFTPASSAPEPYRAMQSLITPSIQQNVPVRGDTSPSAITPFVPTGNNTDIANDNDDVKPMLLVVETTTPTLVVSDTMVVSPEVRLLPTASPQSNGATTIYIVETGDTIDAIALMYGVDIDTILHYNTLSPDDIQQLTPGMELVVPDTLPH